jgi:hypothetical protein
MPAFSRRPRAAVSTVKAIVLRRFWRSPLFQGGLRSPQWVHAYISACVGSFLHSSQIMPICIVLKKDSPSSSRIWTIFEKGLNWSSGVDMARSEAMLMPNSGHMVSKNKSELM